MSCVDAYYNHVYVYMCVLCVNIICTVHVKETAIAVHAMGSVHISAGFSMIIRQ